MPLIVLSDDSRFQAELTAAGANLVIVDFTATWCGPCQRIGPIFEALSRQYTRGAVFIKVDVDANPDTAASQRVSAMPTFVFYRKGKEIDRIQGADPAGLEAKIKGLIGPVQELSFAGQGNRLGSDTPAAPVAASSADDNSRHEAAALAILAVDESKPTTNIQVRLADNTRLVIKANLSNTVGQLKLYIATARPAFGSRVLELMTTFPNKVLNEDVLTVQETNLQGASIVQRFK